MNARPTQVVVVAGLSGAGKSTAIAALEDLGFHSIENVPPAVVIGAIEACEAAGVREIALGMGGGVGGFLDGAVDVLAAIGAGDGRRVTVLFLDASDEVVLRRFNESRRPHPEAQRAHAVHSASVRESVERERERLAALRSLATVVIDTSGSKVHDLRRRVFALMKPENEDRFRMVVRLLSFGFKYGLPTDADLVFDVRFLDNPHFVPELSRLTGEDPRVSDYVLRADGAREFMGHVVGLLTFVLPRYEAEGKSYLTIAIGCTGGQHRSVTIANALVAELGRSNTGAVDLCAVHRDLKESRLATQVGAGAP